MGNNFLKKFYLNCVYSKSDQRVIGIILRYVCWGPPPPPWSLATNRLTR